MTNLFDAKELTRPEDISNPLEHLVGEGKKYKDSNSLAFAALKKDEHISNIESENAEMRETLKRLETELATRGTVEDALARLTKPSTNVESNQDHVTERKEDKSNPEDIQKTVKSILDAERETARRQRNVEDIHSKLEAAWGKDYSKKLNELADELGGKEYLASVAETNPKAFLRMVGADTQAAASPSPKLFDAPTTSRINTASHSTPAIKGHKYYQELRRKDPKGWAKNAGKYEAEMQSAVAQYGNAYFEN